jgi:hypothetical protein
MHTVVELGFNSKAFKEVASLIRILSSPHSMYPGMIDYAQVVRDLKTRPFSWWQEKIQSNCFESRNFLNKDGSFTR